MSHKSPAIARLLDGLEPSDLPRHYAGYFACFNRGLYFEAHDVLEELWLAGGRAGANYHFHKGLIQLAGAFVHLQKQRLRPAVALFDLAESNLVRHRPRHDHLDVEAVLALIAEWRGAVQAGRFEHNPLPERAAPRIEPDTVRTSAGGNTTAPPG
jgi:predicted metal-dependent hydrolase